MSIDLSPFGADALDSRAAPLVAPGEGQTLTLSLRTGRAAGAEAMSGRLSWQAIQAPLPGMQHAGLGALADAVPLTITF